MKNYAPVIFTVAFALILVYGALSNNPYLCKAMVMVCAGLP
jgi:hypothetical protein